MNHVLCLALAATCLTGAAFSQAKKPKKIYSNSYVGKAPPELVTAKGAVWMNSKKPITLAQLKGRVVWLEFSFIH